MLDYWFGYEEEAKIYNAQHITKEEEEALWTELEKDGFIPREVKVLPECAKYIGTDYRGNDLWQGEKITYCLIK